MLAAVRSAIKSHKTTPGSKIVHSWRLASRPTSSDVVPWGPADQQPIRFFWSQPCANRLDEVIKASLKPTVHLPTLQDLRSTGKPPAGLSDVPQSCQYRAVHSRSKSTSATMKAIVITTPGGPEVLQLQDVLEPELKQGEVIVKIAATALNRADTLQRQGNYPPPKGASEYPGLECSGTIEAVGEGVTGWKVGDQVCALLAGGGYAEKVAVPAGQLLPVPQNLTLQEAAALPEVACTVWSTVFMTVNLKAGETFLVHGGSSGIGTFAIQLAKARGARVFCTAGSSAKLDRCKELGADLGINYREEDFVARAKEETGGNGVDVILDNMGGSYLSKNLKALGVGGRLFVIGLQGGRMGEADLGAMLAKRLTISAAGLRSRPSEQKDEIVSQVKKYVWPEVEAGKIKPVIYKVLPLADAAEGHKLMEESTHIGKIVLAV